MIGLSTNEKLLNDNTEFIYQFIQNYGGIEKALKEVETTTKTPVPPPPQIIHQQPPPLPSSQPPLARTNLDAPNRTQRNVSPNRAYK